MDQTAACIGQPLGRVLPSRCPRLPRRLTEQRRLKPINHTVIDPPAHALRSQPTKRMRHDESVKLRQTALLGFELQQVGEGRCTDRDRGNSHLFEED